MLFQKVFISLHSECKKRQIIAVCFRLGEIKKIKYGQQDISFRIISAFCCQRESSNSDANGFAHNGDNVAQSSRSDGKRFSPHCQGRAGYAIVQYAATLKTIACRQRLRGIDTHTRHQRCHRQHILLWQ